MHRAPKAACCLHVLRRQSLTRPTQFLKVSSLTWGGRPPSETVGPPASLAHKGGTSDPPWCCSNARRTDRGPGRCAPKSMLSAGPAVFFRVGLHMEAARPGDTPLPLDGWSSHPGPGMRSEALQFHLFFRKAYRMGPYAVRTHRFDTETSVLYTHESLARSRPQPRSFDPARWLAPTAAVRSAAGIWRVQGLAK